MVINSLRISGRILKADIAERAGNPVKGRKRIVLAAWTIALLVAARYMEPTTTQGGVVNLPDPKLGWTPGFGGGEK